MSRRLTQGVYFEHSEISPGLVYRMRGSSDYLSPSFGYNFARGETLNFAYTYSRNSGGFTAGTSTGNRYDLTLNSQLANRVANTAQVTMGSLQDPLQISSQDQFSVRDSISLPIKSQTLLLGVEHDRVQPSLIAKLNQELGLLSPQLQAEFQANPQAFVDSTNFPPEIKALLAAEQPIGTTFSASTNLSLGAKLRVNPNVSVTHASNGGQANSWTQSFGYSLVYQFRPNLQFRSSLSNVLLWDTRQNSALRTMILSVGFQKSFSAAPGGVPFLQFLHRSRIIEGRVFRDNNINGAFNLGEPGLPGIEVRLEDGEVAMTDAEGRYRFSGISADEHQVSIALTQFRDPVRMTTRGEATADLIQQHIVITNFGILDFARVTGNVYNDLRFENRRQPDSRGMQGITLVLEAGKESRTIQTIGSGDFEFDNVPPGNYKLSLQPASLPPNYLAPVDSIPIRVSPVSTVVEDLPMRALRSISGRVLLKAAPEQKNGSRQSAGARARGKGRGTREAEGQSDNQELVPLAGVQVIAGPSVAISDEDGKFLLRNLPAGDLNVTIRPVRTVPAGINIPAGNVKLPPEPIQIQGASIVVTNAELLPYLTREIPAGIPGLREQILMANARDARAGRQLPMPLSSTPTGPVGNLESSTKPPTAAPSSKQSTAAELPAPVQTMPPAASQQVATLVPSARTAAPVVRVATPESQQNGAVIIPITRAICAAMPSLGEAAQCFQQLKRSAAAARPQ